jgi:hypothetical protein
MLCRSSGGESRNSSNLRPGHGVPPMVIQDAAEKVGFESLVPGETYDGFRDFPV